MGAPTALIPELSILLFGAYGRDDAYALLKISTLLPVKSRTLSRVLKLQHISNITVTG